MTNRSDYIDVPRRTVLKASTIAAGIVAATGPATAAGDRPSQERRHPIVVDAGVDVHTTGDDDVDEPEGFNVDVLAGHAAFPDDVATKFRIKYDEGDVGTIVSDLPCDASSVVFARATWEPEGTSGWHTHPGPVIISITEGELELVNERDCVAHTYAAGEAFIDPGQGNVHIASNPSETDEAVVYATFLGVPDGEPATIWVEPPDC